MTSDRDAGHSLGQGPGQSLGQGLGQGVGPMRTTNTVEAPASRPKPAILLAVGLAIALALGVGLGLWARPDLLKTPKPMTPTLATAAATGPDGKVRILVNPAAPAPLAPAPQSDGPLEVLPPDMASAALAEARQSLGPITPQAPTYDEPQPTEAAAPSAPGEACRGAVTVAERMVCGDRRLSAADRRMARAYQRAIAIGVPAGELDDEQNDWLSIREDAARYSAAAVADVYDQRIRELESLADDGR